MTIKEKINLLNNYMDIETLTDKHFKALQELSYDKDSFVRSMIPPLLTNFIDEAALGILWRLAQDQDTLVRTEVYDSLAVFPFDVVEKLLEKFMIEEKDALARSYAILSWADVTLSLNHVSFDKINVLKKAKSIEESIECSLSFCYALYVFGQNEVLNELLSYLSNENYQVRCRVINLLDEIINKSNESIIKNTMYKLLASENTTAVNERAKSFLEENF